MKKIIRWIVVLIALCFIMGCNETNENVSNTNNTLDRLPGISTNYR